MRISPETSQLVLNALQNLENSEQQDIQQLSTGRRVNADSDDPAAAAVEVNLAYQMDSTNQYLQSISDLASELQTADSSLNSAGTAIQQAISVGVEGANGTLSQQDRTALAQQVQGITQQVLNVANLTYNGRFVFGGTADSQPPYQSDGNGGVTYQGNDGVNYVEVQDGQTIAVNEPGSQLFSAPGTNVFQALEDLSNALESNSSTTEDIGNAVTSLRSAYDQLTTARCFYGNTIDQLLSVQQSQNTAKIQLSAQQNNVVGIDLDAAASNLSNAQTAQNATVEAAASLNSLSLMDYISAIGAQ
ncbi:MAG TPA: flagellar hook-associated protein FlgL [Bryocella sp.]|nr:flagellar hook-associated protein FlgL [Bryocella sp.]